MFNFLFEGKLGEFLAPNSSSPLFAAIQKNDQEVIQNLLSSASTIELCKMDDFGYSAVHVACRFNNVFALQLIFSRGVHVEQPDKNGSTPLHYASKYGHLELCRNLVERGANVGKKNAYNQTPYDLAESHTIRQYLLPLQLSAERQISEQGSDLTPQNYNAVYSSAGMGAYYHQPSSYDSSASSVPVYSQQPPPSLGVQYQHQYQHHSTAADASIQSTIGSKGIVPDGFGSSASDKALQAKYGNNVEVVNIAPPPIMGQTPVQYSAFAGSSGSTYNRYVAYDVNSASVAPPSSSASFSPPNSYRPHSSSSSNLFAPPPTGAGTPQLLPSPSIQSRPSSDHSSSAAVIHPPPVPSMGSPSTMIGHSDLAPLPVPHNSRVKSYEPAEVIDVVSPNSSSVL